MTVHADSIENKPTVAELLAALKTYKANEMEGGAFPYIELFDDGSGAIYQSSGRNSRMYMFSFNQIHHLYRELGILVEEL